METKSISSRSSINLLNKKETKCSKSLGKEDKKEQEQTKKQQLRRKPIVCIYQLLVTTTTSYLLLMFRKTPKEHAMNLPFVE